jgi:hypothetical protein
MGWTDSSAAWAARIAWRVAGERLRPRAAVTREDVPASVERITPAWWTAVLCGAVPGAEVLSATTVGASSGTHQRHRFVLTYNAAGTAAGLPRAVFTKSLPSVLTRMIGGYNGTARAEGRFYVELRPRLDIESPYGYHAAFDRRSLAGINVLEDVAATRGARFCDFRTAVARPMAESMVDLLADLHGHRHGDDTLPRDYRFLANFADWFAIGARKMGTERYTARAIRLMAGQLPRAVVDRAGEIWPRTVAAAAIHRAQPTSVLHSDVHIGNWYQHADSRMGLTDWQCVAHGHYARDLAYMLATALTVDDRRAWERVLVERYVERLSARAGRDIGFDEAWRRYREQMLHALWMWTITLCHSPLLPAMQPVAASHTAIIRIATAMADLESLDVDGQLRA